MVTRRAFAQLMAGAAAMAVSPAESALVQIEPFFGDSVPRGFNAGVFRDAMAGSEPLYQVGSVQSVLNMVCAENSIATRFAYAGSITSYDNLALIDRIMARGIIKTGDTVHVSDAGPHSGDPDEYEEQMARRYKALVDLGLLVCAWMTFDGKVNGGNPPPYDCPLYSRYSHPFGNRTINDAIRAAADQNGVTLIDMEAALGAVAVSAWGGHLLKLIQPDNIHPGVLAGFAMAGAIWTARGLRPQNATVNSVLSVVGTNWETIYGTSQYWPSAGSAQVAQGYASAALLP